jgi:putative tryptophan/tyrosine transport system substrate-binding protein
MKRRVFLACGAGTFAWPLLASAQQAGKVYRIGVLSRDPLPPGLIDGFRERLRELGYIEGQTFAVVSRNADGSHER